MTSKKLSLAVALLTIFIALDASPVQAVVNTCSATQGNLTCDTGQKYCGNQCRTDADIDAIIAGCSASQLFSCSSCSCSGVVTEWIRSGTNVYNTTDKIGIGTASPTSQLHLYKNDNTANAEIAIQSGNGTTLKDKWSIYNNGIGTGDGSLNFWNALASNGGKAMTILPSGNVGIGTTSPTTKLEISGNFVANKGTLFVDGLNTHGYITANSNNILYEVGYLWDRSSVIKWYNYLPTNSNDLAWFSPGGEKMRITAAGNVGIGTTAPSEKLAVNGNILATKEALGGYTVDSGYALTTPSIFAENAAFGAGVTGGLLSTKSGSINAKELCINGDCKTNWASVAGTSQWTITGNDIYSNNTGKVGIGTASPGARLDVADMIRTTAYSTIPTSGTGIEIGYNSTYGQINSYNRTGGAYVPLRIDGLTLALNSGSTGNVGIGTATPGAKLDVTGQVMFGSASETLGIGKNLIFGQISAGTLNGNLMLLQNPVNPADEFRIDNLGNVYINGTIKIAGGTPGAGYVLKSIDTAGNAAWAPESGGIGGSGAVNYVPKFTPDGATLGNSIIQEYNGRIGIGAAALSSGSKVLISDLNGDASLKITDARANGATVFFGAGGSFGEIGVDGNNSFRINTNGLNRIVVTGAGNVGVGNTAPSQLLDIGTSTDTNVPIYIRANAAINRVAGFMLASGGVDQWKIYKPNDGTNDLRINNAGTANLFTIKQSGNIGIGTATPAEKLDVAGGIKIDASVATAAEGIVSYSNGDFWGYIKDLNDNQTPGATSRWKSLTGGSDSKNNVILGSRAILNSTSLAVSAQYNTAVGSDALKLLTTGDRNTALGANTLTLNTTGQWNTAVGVSSMANNVSGSWNSAFGVAALQLNISGYNNIAIGRGALQQNTSGFMNSALGDGALAGNTTGNNNVGLGQDVLINSQTNFKNVGIGDYALNSLNTGSENTAVGYSAGKSATQFTKSIYIGAYSIGLNNDDNTIVIGYNAISSGPNTVTLGNSSIKSVYTSGGIVVGKDTATPVVGQPCNIPGQIVYNSPNFYGCANGTWKQLNN